MAETLGSKHSARSKFERHETIWWNDQALNLEGPGQCIMCPRHANAPQIFGSHDWNRQLNTISWTAPCIVSLGKASV
ncbi:hypothetical protein M3J09_008995 [Ascochyta lentis]